MGIEHLKGKTKEEMDEMRLKGAESRAKKAAERKANEGNYKLSYLDAGLWQELASKWKVRMPVYNEPASVKGIRKYLKRVGITNDEWVESYGPAAQWVENNPRFTLYAAVGHMLELRMNRQ